MKAHEGECKRIESFNVNTQGGGDSGRHTNLNFSGILVRGALFTLEEGVKRAFLK